MDDTQAVQPKEPPQFTPAELEKRKEKQPHPLAYVVTTPLLLWAVINAIQTRTVWDFLLYSFYVAVPLWIAMSVALIGQWREEGLTLRPVQNIFMLLFFALLIFGIAALYYAVGASIKDAYLWIQAPPQSKNQVIVTATAATLVSGLCLFFFRLWFRSIYGLTEALVGLVVAAQHVATEKDFAVTSPSFYLVMLTAGVYLVVRGLDNIHQGMTKDPKDLLAPKLIKLITDSLKKKGAGV